MIFLYYTPTRETNLSAPRPMAVTEQSPADTTAAPNVTRRNMMVVGVADEMVNVSLGKNGPCVPYLMIDKLADGDWESSLAGRKRGMKPDACAELYKGLVTYGRVEYAHRIAEQNEAGGVPTTSAQWYTTKNAKRSCAPSSPPTLRLLPRTLRLIYRLTRATCNQHATPVTRANVSADMCTLSDQVICGRHVCFVTGVWREESRSLCWWPTRAAPDQGRTELHSLFHLSPI